MSFRFLWRRPLERPNSVGLGVPPSRTLTVDLSRPAVRDEPPYRPTVAPSHRRTVLPSHRPTVAPSHRRTVALFLLLFTASLTAQPSIDLEAALKEAYAKAAALEAPPTNPSAVAPSPATTPATSSLSDTNLLQPADRLTFFIEDDPVQAEEPMPVVVTDLGQAQFPVSRGFATTITLEVTNKSLTDLRHELKQRLDAEYYQDARIKLNLVGRRDTHGTAFFFGAVRGSVKLAPGQDRTVAEAILELGYSDFANLKRVTVSRSNPETGASRLIPLNIQAVLDGDRQQDLVLKDGDRVEVAHKSFLIR